MPEPLDLEAIRERADLADMAQKVEEAAQIAGRLYGASVPPHSNEVKMQHASAADVPALIAEIERLRLIAAPLERLEAWASGGDGETRRYVISLCWDGSTLASLRILEADKAVEIRAANMAEAATAALNAWDAWDAKYGKDGP